MGYVMDERIFEIARSHGVQDMSPFAAKEIAKEVRKQTEEFAKALLDDKDATISHLKVQVAALQKHVGAGSSPVKALSTSLLAHQVHTYLKNWKHAQDTLAVEKTDYIADPSAVLYLTPDGKTAELTTAVEEHTVSVYSLLVHSDDFLALAQKVAEKMITMLAQKGMVQLSQPVLTVFKQQAPPEYKLTLTVLAGYPAKLPSCGEILFPTKIKGVVGKKNPLSPIKPVAEF